MTTHLSDAWRTLVPLRGDAHGPLPPYLVMLTIVTGLVDAFSYLELGRVFVANMTGNVVFLAFALGGTAGFLWWASLLAIASFLLGAFLGGLIASRRHSHRGVHILRAATVELGLVAVAFVLALTLGSTYSGVSLAILVVILSLALGLQNATARALGVPDLTTTVLTLTLTGIAADSRLVGGKGSKLGRRAVSVLAMFVGALIGTLMVHAGAGAWVLLVAAAVLAVLVALAFRHRATQEAWALRG